MSEPRVNEGASEIIYLRSHIEGLKESQLRSERLIEKLSESVISLSEKVQQVAEAQISFMTDAKHVNEDVTEMKLELAKAKAGVATVEAESITLNSNMVLLKWLFAGLCTLNLATLTVFLTWIVSR